MYVNPVDHCLYKVGSDQRTVESQRSSGRTQSSFVDQYDEPVRLYLLLWHPRRNRRSHGQSAHRQCNPLHNRVTLVRSLDKGEINL